MKNYFSRFALALFLGVIVGCSPIAVWTDGEVPFVPTTPEVIDRMLDLAQVKSSDLVYDLGSGDGRIIIQAAKSMEREASVSRLMPNWCSELVMTPSKKKWRIWSNSGPRTRLLSTSHPRRS